MRGWLVGCLVLGLFCGSAYGFTYPPEVEWQFKQFDGFGCWSFVGVDWRDRFPVGEQVSIEVDMEQRGVTWYTYTYDWEPKMTFVVDQVTHGTTTAVWYWGTPVPVNSEAFGSGVAILVMLAGSVEHLFGSDFWEMLGSTFLVMFGALASLIVYRKTIKLMNRS